MSCVAFILALLVSSTALATDICTPMAKIESNVNYCDENSAFVAPAQTCRDLYKAQVKKANEEVARNLTSLMKNANTQDADFHAMQAVLGTTKATLSDLIKRGQEIYFEAENYEEDFVLPIYEGYEEDFFLDPHSTKGQTIFREKECYGEPMEDIDKVKADVKKMAMDLEKTKAMAEQLYAAVKAKSKLGSLGDAAVQGNGKSGPGNKPGVEKGGESQNGESGITGVDEAERKDAKLPEDSPAP